jgi:outer membrane protein insertion porin family
MRWRNGGLAGVLIVVSAAAAQADPADYAGLPVSSVEIAVEGRDGDEALLNVIETQAGAPLSLHAVRESIVHLVSLGRFENVVVHAAPSEDGVALVYDLTPTHPIERVAVEGGAGPGIDAGRLRRAVLDQFGASIPVARSAEIVAFVAAELRARGYQRARVSATIDERHAPDYSVLRLVLEPGARTAVGAIEVVASSGPPPRDLPAALDVAPGDPYEPDVLAARIEEYLADRRQRGYFEAGITLTARFRDLDRIVDLTLAATDGPHVRVVFEGDGLPAGARGTLVPVAAQASADEDLLEDSTNRIEEYLRRQGYRDAAAPYRRGGTPAEQVITFTIRRGPLYVLAGVELSGHQSVAASDLLRAMALEEGGAFVQADLERSADAILSLYRRLGFTAVTIETEVVPAGVSSPAGPQALLVRFGITENARTVVESIGVEGNQSVSDEVLLDGIGLRPGGPLLLQQMTLDRDVLEVRYANLGYPYAAVTVAPRFSDDSSTADVRFTVREGPRLVVEHVLIGGNTRTRRETISRELRLGPGDPLGAAAVLESQRRLAALALFRRVRITALSHGGETRRDLVVTVDETPATTIGYGGGAEVSPRTGAADGGAVERLEVRPRAFFEIGRRNLFGKNRSVSLFTRLSLRSDDTPAAQGVEPADASRFGFAEYRVLGTFREPRVFDTQADAFLAGTIEQHIRPSFKFARRAFSAELARAITPTTSVSGSYEIQRTRLFDDVINEDEARLIDRVFPQVRLSSFSVSAVRDTRDDQLSPTLGRYVSVSTQFAARRIGSEVGFVRSFATAQLFRLVPRTGGAVFAASARLGLATGFPREVFRRDADGQLVLGPDGQPLTDVVEDLPASERFFAGGDTTVRGFALDQLGTAATVDQDGFPIGGSALAIFNAELRVPVAGGLGLVGFFDLGNVFARAADLDLGQLRSAVGLGVRYASPVGPIRVDLGFKTNRREISPGRLERLTALHISLGQAF